MKNHFDITRGKATVISVVLLAVVGVTAALSNSTMAGVKMFGLTPFDLFDYVSSNLLLPLGGLFLSVFVGWFWGYPQVRDALSNEGKLKNEKVIKLVFGVLRFVTPVLVLIIMLKGLKVF